MPLTDRKPKTETSPTSTVVEDPLKDPLDEKVDKMSGMNDRNMKNPNLNTGGKQSGVVMGSTVGGEGTELTLNQSTGMSPETSSTLGTSVQGGIIGLAKLGQGVNGIMSGFDKRKEGREQGDKGLETLGTKDLKTHTSNTVQESIGLSSTGLEMVKTVGKLGGIGTKMIPGLNVLSDTISGGLAVRRLVKQVRRSKRLGDTDMASSRGPKWKQKLEKRTEVQKGMSGLQIALAGLGIAGTVVGLLSNPVGWIIGVVGALGAGGIALAKLGKSINDKTKTMELTRKTRMVDRAFEGKEVTLTDMSRLMTKDMRTKEGYERSILDDGTLVKDDETFDPKDFMKEKWGGKKKPKKEKTGFEHLYEPTEEKPEKELTRKERKRLKKEADRVQRMVTEMAGLAGELRDAIVEREADFVGEYRKWESKCQKALKMRYGVQPVLKLSEKANQFLDAMALIEALGLSYDEVVSDSGQQLLERKLTLP